MWRDDAYLLDMLIHARKARDFCFGASAEKLRSDDLLQAAVLHVLQIVGEAAAKVSPGFRDGHPQIPWPMIIGLRNRLVHDYPRIDLGKVWEIVQRDIPPLITALEGWVPPDTTGPSKPE